jgi:2-polyprenyl-3-methyl-5-hydroxy-6-metoxy-1,4-benzoquinol methylase
MFDKRDDCPVCAHITFQNYLICQDHTVTGESFALVQCKHCTHVFTNPRPDALNTDKYYNSTQYISHTNKALNPIQWMYKIVRSRTLKSKEQLLRKLNPNASTLLDFGCGTGHFLEYCQSKKWTVQGVEPNQIARSKAQSSVKSVAASLEEASSTYDIITAWHVLEHIPEPVETLKQLAGKLTSTGKIVLGLPNHKSFDARNYGSYWAGYDVPRHLSHFNQQSLTELAKRLKLKVDGVLPMKYDAYYVSMLSEQYIGNKLSPIKGYLIGKQSNKSAKQTGEYSSLIYILSK